MKIRPAFQFLGAAVIGIAIGLLLLALAIGPDSRGNMSLKSPLLGLCGLISFVVGICCLAVAVAKPAAASVEKLSSGKQETS